MPQPEDYATTEQRERGARYWTDVIRPQMVAKEQAAPPEDPHAVLARIKSEGWSGVPISTALATNLGIKKNEQAA